MPDTEWYVLLNKEEYERKLLDNGEDEDGGWYISLIKIVSEEEIPNLPLGKEAYFHASPRQQDVLNALFRGQNASFGG